MQYPKYFVGIEHSGRAVWHEFDSEADLYAAAERAAPAALLEDCDADDLLEAVGHDLSQWQAFDEFAGLLDLALRKGDPLHKAARELVRQVLLEGVPDEVLEALRVFGAGYLKRVAMRAEELGL